MKSSRYPAEFKAEAVRQVIEQGHGVIEVIEPHYPKAGNGTQPLPMERMLCIYFMQQWFSLSDPGGEDAPYDSESIRRFGGVKLVDDVIPDESTILRFRHLLERHRLTEAMFAEIRTLLEEKRLLIKSGTIVDATIIAAPPSTKKAHAGTDPRGIVHSLTTTAANVHDSTQIAKLLHGQEREVYGDQAYWNESHRQGAQAVGIRYRINRRRARHPLTQYQRHLNRVRSGTLRACLSGGQAPVGLSQSALSRLGEKHSPPVRCLCLGECVSAAATFVASTGAVRPMSAHEANIAHPTGLPRLYTHRLGSPS